MAMADYVRAAGPIYDALYDPSPYAPAAAVLVVDAHSDDNIAARTHVASLPTTRIPTLYSSLISDVPIEPSLAGTAMCSPSTSDLRSNEGLPSRQSSMVHQMLSPAFSEDPYAHGDVMPQPFIDDLNGETVYPCQYCAKQYTGKHARSIWRRHLQDKHSIPLSQQPRRTRWDNVADRPKTDTERRERTLESKRRWARKNRALQRARAAGLPEPKDEDFDEEGFPLPGTQLAVVTNAISRNLRGGLSDTTGSGISTAASPYSPTDYDISHYEQDRLVQIDPAIADSPRRAVSLAPFSQSRPQFNRNVSEPPEAVYGASYESHFAVPAAPPLRSHHSALGTVADSGTHPFGYAYAASFHAPLFHDDDAARSIYGAAIADGSRHDRVSELQPAAEIADSHQTVDVFATSPRRSPRRLHRTLSDETGVSSEEAAMQLLALKTSSPAQSPSKVDESFATSASVSDFSFQLPRDASSPPSSSHATPELVRTKRGLQHDKSLAQPANSRRRSANDDDLLRPTKRARSASVSLMTPHREPLVAAKAGSTPEYILNESLPPSSPRDQHRGEARAGRRFRFTDATNPSSSSSSAAVLPPHAGRFHAIGSAYSQSSPPGFQFSSPGNTDLSRSLGLVPESMPAIFGTPAFKGSSPAKARLWTLGRLGHVGAPSSPPSKEIDP